MWPTIFSLLQSSERSRRLHGWRQLQSEIELQHIAVTDEQYWRLQECLLAEDEDDGVWRHGMTVFVGLLLTRLLMDKSPRTSLIGSRQPPDTLTDWLWDPFHYPSVVVSMRDPNMMLRDEDALIALRGHLSRRDYPRTEFLRYLPGDSRWGATLHHTHFETICLVGRMGLFGPEAVQRWGLDETRFNFRMQDRPENIEAGALDRQYHCIYERLADGSEKDYFTTEAAGIRSDYGLVQRYVVFDGFRHVTVVICAGASSLGTLAAVQWAAEHLNGSVHPDGEPIPLPPNTRLGSRFEALIFVTADATQNYWRPSRLELEQLHVGHFTWNKDTRQWQAHTPEEITLVLDGKNPDHPSAVLFDGLKVGLKTGSQNFHLLARTIQAAYMSNSGAIDIAKLAADPWIWSTPPVSEKTVRRGLSLLKFRYLHDALSLTEDICLRARVALQPAAVGLEPLAAKRPRRPRRNQSPTSQS